MDSTLLASLDSSFWCELEGDSLCPARLMDELRLGVVFAVWLMAASLLVGIPGSNLMVGSEMVVPPSRPSNREIKLSFRGGPPTSPHGIQTLYDGPIDVLLMCDLNWSAVNTNLRSGF